MNTQTTLLRFTSDENTKDAMVAIATADSRTKRRPSREESIAGIVESMIKDGCCTADEAPALLASLREVCM